MRGEGIRFQPTRPLRGATPPAPRARSCRKDFNPRAPCGARHLPVLGKRFSRNFNPRAPCGARQPSSGFPTQINTKFQPTRPLRGATAHRPRGDRRSEISTHAPLAGRDISCTEIPASVEIFQPTRPLRGATGERVAVHAPAQFQPTRPLRGATRIFDLLILEIEFQPTRPLRGATTPQRPDFCGLSNFNPRAPCGARRGGSPAGGRRI